MSEMVRWSLFGIAASAFGVAVWMVLTRTRPLRWHRPPRRRRVGSSATDMADNAPWRVLLPQRWMRWGIKNMQWAAGAALGTATLGITGNPVTAVAFGWIGFLLPEIILRDIAWARWTALDRAAYTTVYSARFYLEQGVSVLQTWRRLVPDAPAVFQDWVAPCLLSESGGTSFETVLKQQSLAIQHMELAVAADIFEAERRHGGALGALAQALQLWGQRMELDADRRGSLTGFIWISRITLGVGIALFWGMTLGDAAIRAAMHSASGAVVTGVSAGLLAVGVALYQGQRRSAERF